MSARPPAGAGHLCPIDYRYPPATFARPPELVAATLYVVGGLYGNQPALEAIEAMRADEPEAAEVVFNGDFHWFDVTPERFAAVDRGVLAHRAMRGNVETELSRATDAGAGCGCAYPDSVDDRTVERSNRILARLQRCARSLPEACERLARLPMTLVARVGALRVGIVHGDAESLAGWKFAAESLDAPSARAWLESVRAASGVDVFASSHTCAPALRDFALAAGRLTVINNGAAGMPNFRGELHGLITRIGVRRSPHRALYGIERDGVFVEALRVRYDHARWLREFLADWPPGSDAHASYYSRIATGA